MKNYMFRADVLKDDHEMGVSGLGNGFMTLSYYQKLKIIIQ